MKLSSLNEKVLTTLLLLLTVLVLDIYSNPIGVIPKLPSNHPQEILGRYPRYPIFVEEEAHLHLSETKWSIDGLYIFANNTYSSEELTIEYPIAGFLWYDNIGDKEIDLPEVYPSVDIVLDEVRSHKLSRLRVDESSIDGDTGRSKRARFTLTLPGLSRPKTSEPGQAPLRGVRYYGQHPGERAAVRIRYSLDIPNQPPETAGKGSNRLRSVPLATYFTTTALSWEKPISKARFILTVDNGITVNNLPFPNPGIERNSDSVSYTWELVDYVPTEDFLVDFRYNHRRVN